MNFEKLTESIKHCNTLDELFDIWKQAHKYEKDYEETTIIEAVKTKKGEFEGISKESFIKDGFICEQEYLSASKKVLFVLKESNIQTHRSQWQLDHPSECDQFGFYTNYINGNESDNIPKQHEKMARIAHYIIYNEDIKDVEILKATLNKTAFMNINKRGGGASTNENKFWNYENKYLRYIKRQIEILNPDVIVILGKNISENIIPNDFRNRFIKFYHTAYRYKAGIYNPDGYMKEFIEAYKRLEEVNL